MNITITLLIYKDRKICITSIVQSFDDTLWHDLDKYKWYIDRHGYATSYMDACLCHENRYRF
jgi:hypothetical protein